jgi:hypothetical protein
MRRVAEGRSRFGDTTIGSLGSGGSGQDDNGCWQNGMDNDKRPLLVLRQTTLCEYYKTINGEVLVVRHPTIVLFFSQSVVSGSTPAVVGEMLVVMHPIVVSNSAPAVVGEVFVVRHPARDIVQQPQRRRWRADLGYEPCLHTLTS